GRGLAVRARRHGPVSRDEHPGPFPGRFASAPLRAPRRGRGSMSAAFKPYRRARDFGTPKRVSERLVTLTIDGESVTVPEGTSVLRAAAEAGINIPKLCATDMQEPFGSCRLCLVEIEGAKGLPASC